MLLIPVDHCLDLGQFRSDSPVSIPSNPAESVPQLAIRASTFAQDLLIPFEDADMRSLMAPFSPEYPYWNQFLPLCLLREPHTRLKPVFTYFQGGNILMGEGYAVVGKDTWSQNEGLYGLSLWDFEQHLKSILHVEKVFITGSEDPMASTPADFSQGEYQPVFHIDMYITLAGPDDSDGTELVFVGDLAGKGAARAACPDDPISILLWQIQYELDRAANDLSRRKIGTRRFKVVRIPLYLDYEGARGQFLSFNNCLVEVNGGEKTIFAPSYLQDEEADAEIRQLQDRTEAIFASCGFRTIWLEGNYLSLARMSKGSLHCLANVIRRG